MSPTAIIVTVIVISAILLHLSYPEWPWRKQ